MSTPTDEAQDCTGGPCEECDDWGGGTCALCDRYFCGNCWSTPAHDCAAAVATDEARELAKRWAFNEAGAPAYGADAICEPEPLDDADRERLFAWVRTRMQDVWNSVEPRKGLLLDGGKSALAEAITDDLGIDGAWTLCEAAGWPS